MLLSVQTGQYTYCGQIRVNSGSAEGKRVQRFQMNNNISFGQYRGIDLTILTILTTVAEAVSALAASKWFPREIYSLSPMVAMVSIVMMRWDFWAAIPAAVSGLAFCVATGASGDQFLVYCVGNCGVLAALVWFKAFGKEKVRKHWGLSIVFTFTAFAGMLLGRWLVAMLLGSGVKIIVNFLLADCLSVVFAAVVVLIARRIDGLFEDQKAYLIRTEEERKKQRDDEANYYD